MNLLSVDFSRFRRPVGNGMDHHGMWFSLVSVWFRQYMGAGMSGRKKLTHACFLFLDSVTGALYSITKYLLTSLARLVWSTSKLTYFDCCTHVVKSATFGNLLWFLWLPEPAMKNASKWQKVTQNSFIIAYCILNTSPRKVQIMQRCIIMQRWVAV